ncbi:MAG TPA: prephenate dehydrogenase/arogenate dehydrogenase family protein [Burkholderiales bacterium]|jgi:prephenate dehydrogenase|nr:prephenate dehydrogenase/arogenate dehydrogenase family protein [Burkholderiales bacterium]
MLFERVAILGVGLIGGSFALALKEARACAHVVGAGRNSANLGLALERRVIDSIAADAVAAAHGADLVLLAAPLAQFPKLFRDIAPVLGPKAVVTDGGSTKRDVVAAARAALGRRIGQFVPAHPIAGGEKSGAGAANAELFRGKRVIMTPLGENSDSTLRKVEDAWSACGARVTSMDAEEHDAILGAVSHLPHVLAFALVHELASRDNAAQLFGYAAGGFRDFTRIASSHPEMWRDICIANRDRLLDELKNYRGALDAMAKLLEAGDAAGLEKVFAEAREARERWIQSS